MAWVGAGTALGKRGSGSKDWEKEGGDLGMHFEVFEDAGSKRSAGYLELRVEEKTGDR